MPASAHAAVPPLAAPRGLARVETFSSVADVRAAWDELLIAAPASAYQTPDWIEAWCATRGMSWHPLLVVGFDARGPVALLPLGIMRRGGLRVAGFLGGRDANLGLGLFHPDVDWTAPTVRHLLSETARLGAVDVVRLSHQPHGFAGRPNPLAALPWHASPSLQHEAVLDASPEAFLARTLSGRARKHIRQKETKLAALGPVRHERSHDPETADEIVTALLAQREGRFGPVDPDGSLRAFLLTANRAPHGATPAVELHALRCGDTIVSAFAGAGHAGRFSGMMLSFAAAEPWARHSPGELLVARIMAETCREGFATFDLGVGEARYKASFCPVAVPLFDTVIGFGIVGQAAATALRAGLAAKRRVKQSPRLWTAVQRLRAWRRGLSGRFPV